MSSALLDEQIQELRILKRIVKKHDLQLRECEYTLCKDFLLYLDDSENMESIAQEKLLDLESRIEETCQCVDKERREIDESIDIVRGDLRSLFTDIFRKNAEHQSIVAEIEILKRDLDVGTDGKISAKEMDFKDVSFQKLAQERRQIDEERRSFRIKIEEIENDIRCLECEWEQCNEEEKKLQKEEIETLQCHEELRNNVHLDPVANDILQPNVLSTELCISDPVNLVPGNLVSENMDSPRLELPGHSVKTADLSNPDTPSVGVIFNQLSETLNRTCSTMGEEERKAVSILLDTRKKEYRITEKIIYYLSLLNLAGKDDAREEMLSQSQTLSFLNRKLRLETLDLLSAKEISQLEKNPPPVSLLCYAKTLIQPDLESLESSSYFKDVEFRKLLLALMYAEDPEIFKMRLNFPEPGKDPECLENPCDSNANAATRNGSDDAENTHNVPEKPPNVSAGGEASKTEASRTARKTKRNPPPHVALTL